MRPWFCIAIILLAGCAAPQDTLDAATGSGAIHDDSVLVYEMIKGGTPTGETVKIALTAQRVLDPYGFGIDGIVVSLTTTLDDPAYSLKADHVVMDRCGTPLAASMDGQALSYFDMPTSHATALLPFLATPLRDAPDVNEITGGGKLSSQHYDDFTIIPGDGYDVRLARDGDAVMAAIGYVDGTSWVAWAPGFTWFDPAPVPTWFSIGGPRGDVYWQLVSHDRSGEPLPNCDQHTVFSGPEERIPAGRLATADSPGIDPPLAWLHDQVDSGRLPEATLFLRDHPDAYISNWAWSHVSAPGTYPGAVVLDTASPDRTWMAVYQSPGGSELLLVFCDKREGASSAGDAGLVCMARRGAGNDAPLKIDFDGFAIVPYAHALGACDVLGASALDLEMGVQFWDGQRNAYASTKCGAYDVLADAETGRIRVVMLPPPAQPS